MLTFSEDVFPSSLKLVPAGLVKKKWCLVDTHSGSVSGVGRRKEASSTPESLIQQVKCSLLVQLSLGPDDVVLESSFHCYGNVISVLYGESQRLHCNTLGLKGCLGSSWFILWNWVQKAWPMENSESHIWIVHPNARKGCTYSKGNGILLPQRKGYWQIHNESQGNTVMCFYREQEIIVFGARNCWTLNHWVKLQWLF